MYVICGFVVEKIEDKDDQTTTPIIHPNPYNQDIKLLNLSMTVAEAVDRRRNWWSLLLINTSKEIRNTTLLLQNGDNLQGSITCTQMATFLI